MRPNMRTLPGWQRALALVRASDAQTINLDELLFFEIDRNSENSPLLVLRAQMGSPLEASFVALDDPTLALLGRPEGEPLILSGGGEDIPFAPLLALFARCGFACGLVAPVRHGERLSGCLVGCSAGPRAFTPSDVAVFKLLASYLAVVVENDRLRAETDFRFSEAMSLEAVSSALVEERSLDAILSLIIDEAMRVLNACDALVLLLDAERDDQWFQVRARKGQGLEGLTRGRLSVIDSLNGMVIRTGKPLVSQDARTDPRANQARARRLNVGTVVIAPLNIRHKTIGTIAVHNKREGYFGETDVDVLCSLANQAAIAIDNARLFNELLGARDEIERKACELQQLLAQTLSIQEDERRRIAADIHDRVISRIVGALYELETCTQLYLHGESLHGQLQLLKELLNEATDKTRASIYNLWPATLDHMGLVPALRELLSHQAARNGLQHSVQVYGTPYRLRPAVRIAVYRIVQEALTNIQQHGAASAVE
ncbi:MAG: GAF domain-containing protein, partial [Chloroflexi bacterium]